MIPSERFNIVLLDDDATSNFINATLLKMANVVEELNVFTKSTLALDYLYNQLKTNFCTEKPALLLIDINMPEMDGFQFIETLQSVHPSLHNQINICFLSSSSHHSDKKRAHELGADQYLEKPLTPDKITSLISSLRNIAG